jgi:aminopeptidase N
MITCAGPADVDWLRVWLAAPAGRDGTTRAPRDATMGAPRDVPIDTEMRWLIALRLAALGAFGDGDIEAELDRERTSVTVEHAARARAARPDRDAKAAAWAAIIHDDTLSNRLLFATARGFWQPRPADLTASYVDQYIAEVPAMAARRTAQVAERLARLAFPAYSVDPGTLAAMTRMRDDESLVPALRRALIDETDELARSVAARDLAAQMRRARDEEGKMHP